MHTGLRATKPDTAIVSLEGGFKPPAGAATLEP